MTNAVFGLFDTYSAFWRCFCCSV